MHSRKKGKSGSSRPYRKSAPEWVEYSGEEIEEMVVKLAREGRSPSDIGRLMRDQYGVPSVKLCTGRSVTQILVEKGVKYRLPEDLTNLIKKAVAIEKHLSANPGDMSSKRGLQLTESKIRRLVKYYKREKRLPEDWRYSLARAKLLVK